MSLGKFKIFVHQHRLFLFTFALLLTAYLFARPITNTFFPQQTISLQDIASIPGGIKDYSMSEDGSLQSSSFDSWVYLEYESLGIQRPVTVTFNIENMQDDDPGFIMYYVDSYLSQSGTKEIGSNNLSLLYRSAGDKGLRFDFTTLNGQTIKLSPFIFNDNNALTALFREKVLNLSLYLGIVFLISLAAAHIPNQPSDQTESCSRPKHIFYVCSAIFYIILGAVIALAPVSRSSLHLGLKWILCLIIGTSACAIMQIGLKEHRQHHFILRLVCRNLIVMLTLFILQIGVHVCLFDYLPGEWCHYFRNEFMSPSMMVNMLLVLSLYTIPACILGFGWASLINGILGALLIIGNIIKVYFQKELLSIADLFLLKEVFGIAQYFVSGKLLIFIIVLIIAAAGLIIYNRKLIKHALKPSCSLKNLWLLFPCFGFLLALSCNRFQSVGIDATKEYRLTQDAVSDYGIGVYYYYMLSKGISTPAPDGYGPDIVDEVASYQKAASSEDAEPNVILILAESLFRADQLPDIQFNYDLFENTINYMKSTAISPSYGGRTAAAEFEALTGYSDYFLPNDVIAYTTYITNPKRKLGSLAQEFRDAGYHTIAMHPNRANYYNRNTVYESMGFETFLDITAFDTSPENILNDGFLKDDEFFDVMIDELEKSDTPTFIFGATIAGHSPYKDKYTETQIQATSSLYTSDALSELSKYGQTAYDLDQQLGRLFDYLDQSEKPTLVFVFGDHLPPLEIYSQSNYLADTEVKYSTPVITYSNYSELDLPEKFSLSHLAPLIIEISGIPHRAYFDFLYDFGVKHPILQKEFPVTASEEELNLYEKIQYDSLFGGNYLVNSNH